MTEFIHFGNSGCSFHQLQCVVVLGNEIEIKSKPRMFLGNNNDRTVKCLSNLRKHDPFNNDNTIAMLKSIKNRNYRHFINRQHHAKASHLLPEL